MTYQATIADTKEEFQAAVGNQKPVIVLRNEACFWEVEDAAKKAAGTKGIKRVGNTIMLVGGAAALLLSFWGGIAAVVAGGGVKLLGSTAAKAFRKHFKEYGYIFDYNSRYVFFLKLTGEAKIETGDKPWVDIGGLYPESATEVELRLIDGSSVSNRIEDGILKLDVSCR